MTKGKTQHMKSRFWESREIRIKEKKPAVKQEHSSALRKERSKACGSRETRRDRDRER